MELNFFANFISVLGSKWAVGWGTASWLIDLSRAPARRYCSPACNVYFPTLLNYHVNVTCVVMQLMRLTFPPQYMWKCLGRKKRKQTFMVYPSNTVVKDKRMSSL